MSRLSILETKLIKIEADSELTRTQKNGEIKSAIYEFHSSILGTYREWTLRKQVKLARYKRIASNPDKCVVRRLETDVKKFNQMYEDMLDAYRSENFLIRLVDNH